MINYNRYEELLNGDKPQNREEFEWLNNFNKKMENSKQQSEDYQKRYTQAQKETAELVEKYNSKEYKPFGKFNNPLFKLKENKIDKLVEEEIEKHPEIKEDGIIDIFYYQTKVKLFKELYNIDWFPKETTLSEKFLEEYNAILDKYNIKCDVLSSIL